MSLREQYFPSVMPQDQMMCYRNKLCTDNGLQNKNISHDRNHLC
uniref:Uncharacterized protein n=1 Tax=Arundo donax TaxID=35708 RepID=A0A0A9BRR4_ARUDO